MKSRLGSTEPVRPRLTVFLPTFLKMSRSALKRLLLSSRIKPYKQLIHSRSISASSCRLNVRDNILYCPDTVNIPRISLSEYLFQKAEPYSDLVAFECPLTHKKYTYGEIIKYSKNLSKFLRKKLGLNKGDCALIYLANGPDFPIAAWGCLEAGVIASTVNSLYTSEEIFRQLQDSSAKIIITSCELYENAAKAVAQLSRKVPIVCVKSTPDQLLPQGAIDFSQVINLNLDIPDLEPPSPDDIAILPYSSGTTGLPKGVKLTHTNILANIEQVGHPNIDFTEPASATFQEVSPGVLPMFHIYGFVICTLKLMVNGAKILTVPRFHPETFIDIIKNYPLSLVFAAPPLILFLTHHPDVKIEYLKHVKHIMSGAAPLGASDEERFIEKFGDHLRILQGYGLTETSPVVSLVAKNVIDQYKDVYKGSIGKVVPQTEVKLVKLDDSSGTPLGPNENGEILVRGPQVMKGYHNKPEATKASFLDGWFRTGDLAYYDNNGLIFIADRVKELIKVRGFQVAPAELEEILKSHPKVADAAVVAIPDEISGEIPRAYVKTKANVNSDEIYKFVAEKVAKYKRLEGGIEFVKEIPRNSAGKILRRQDRKSVV